MGWGTYGSGVYLTSSTNPLDARIQGAVAAEAVIRIAAAGIPIARTLWPAIFRVPGMPLALP
jgi:hypothetical protein